MRVGVPTEVKSGETRVALTPAGARELTARGHRVLVQVGAGAAAGFGDGDYVAAGAALAGDAEAVWGASDVVVKVKEPVPSEYPLLRADLVLFTYLHLAASRGCTEALVRAGTTAVAYETVQLASGVLPLLAPMSTVAGRLATQVGARALEAGGGGRGVLLGGVPGVAPADVVVLGAGNAGAAAADVAVGMGARVTVLDLSVERLRALADRHGGRVATVVANRDEVLGAVLAADLVVGAVLVPGARAPKLVANGDVARMRPGSALVDIAIDQGGCFEDSRPTTHAAPCFTVHRSVLYCVANMPAAVPHTATRALVNATLPYVVALADHGWEGAARRDPALAAGVNVTGGAVVSAPVAQAHGMVSAPLFA